MIQPNIVLFKIYKWLIQLYQRIFSVEKKQEESEKIEDEYFQEIYDQWKGTKAKDKDLTYKVIPKFYFKV